MADHPNRNDEQMSANEGRPAEGSAASRLTVAVSGAGGLVGKALVTSLKQRPCNVVRLVRRDADDSAGELRWDADVGIHDRTRIDQFDAVVHLAGENIAAGRWTAARKGRIRSSRVDGTTALCRSLASANSPPRVLVCASAIGFYGDRGDEVLDESSAPGEGFLADVCTAWETATAAAKDSGIRVVNLRIGVVISRDGGALSKMLTPFRLGAGGIVGSGRQYWSWIALDDLVNAIEHTLEHDDLEGAVNAVGPQPLTNAEFTRVLGKVLRRPTIFPMPAFVARLALGEMADDLLLAGTRVEPKRLLASGFEFRYPGLRECLEHELNENTPESE